MADQQALRVAVISPHQLIRAGLSAIIGGERLRAQVDAVHLDLRAPLPTVDVILYDLDGLQDGGLELASLVRASVPVVGMSQRDRPDRVRGAGALGLEVLFASDAVPAVILDALNEAVAGRRKASDPAALSRAHHRAAGEGLLDSALTRREVEILRLIGQGKSNQEIAAEMFLSINSVKTYIRTAYRRIGVTTRPQAVLWLADHGMLTAGPQILDGDPAANGHARTITA